MNFNHKPNSAFLRGAAAILALALATALFPGGGETASAGTCTETATGGTWTCSGAADTTTDTTQTLTADTSENLVVTSEPGFGIGNSIMLTAATGSLGIDATIGGPVTSTQRNVIGVNASHQGSGSAAINVGAVNSMGIGVRVETTSSADAVTVNASGDIFTRDRGIDINHQGTGAVAINSEAVNAVLDGISVVTTSAATGGLTINATGDVSSDSRAIRIDHRGAGAVAIDASGFVRAVATGIEVRTTSAATGGLTINATGGIRGNDGIGANHQGSGAVVINSGGINAEATGINVATTASAVGVTVNATGDIFARNLNINTRGININHQGGGAVVVHSSGAINSGGRGVSVETSSAAGGLTVNATGGIFADGFGININHQGAGAAVINSGDIVTNSRGINIIHHGSGAVVINSGNTESTSHGILVETTSAADSVTVNSTGDIITSSRGINILHQGSGAVVVDSGSINSGGRGISIETSSATDSVTVNATGDIFALFGFAININHQGTGAAVINSGSINTLSDAINVATSSTVSGVTVNSTGDIFADNRGISVNHQGSGAVVINSGNINIGDDNPNDTGINVETTSAADSVTVNATGDITTGSRAINAIHRGGGELSIFLAPDADITTTGSPGIYAHANTAGHSGNPAGGMNIVVMGDIGSPTSTVSSGVVAEHHSRGDLNITVGGNIDTHGPSTGRGIDAATGADSSAVNINLTGDLHTSTEGIVVAHQGTGDVNINIAPGASINAHGGRGIAVVTSGSASRDSDIIVDISGTVRGSSPVAVSATSSNGALVRLRPGARIIGEISATSSNSVLEFAAAATPVSDTTRFDLGQLDGFDTILKTGPETWELTGTVSAAAGTSLSLDNGVLILDENADVTTANFAGNGGRLVMSANFASGRANPDAHSALFIEGDLTGTTPVELRISGSPPATAAINNIYVSGSPDAANVANHFIGSAVSGLYAFELNCRNTTGACSFDRDGFSPAGGVIESYAATLAELSSLPSMRQRLEGRVRSEESEEKEDTGIWGRIEGAFASFDPGVSATGSEYDIQDTRIRFGADYPLEDIGLTLGGNLWFGLSNTDISPANGKIETTGYAAAITAAVEQGDFYADAQFQYALFSSDLSASDFPTSGSDASAFSVSGEVGYDFPLSALGGFNVIPQAQIIWVSADFDDINIGRGQTASLEDGGALTGRVGVFADRELKGSEGEYGDAGEGNVYAGLNLLVPLDGETAARVGAETLTSELEGVAGELNVGGSYAWGGKYSVFGEAAVSLGSEVAEYRANVGLRFGF